MNSIITARVLRLAFYTKVASSRSASVRKPSRSARGEPCAPSASANPFQIPVQLRVKICCSLRKRAHVADEADRAGGFSFVWVAVGDLGVEGPAVCTSTISFLCFLARVLCVCVSADIMQQS